MGLLDAPRRPPLPEQVIVTLHDMVVGAQWWQERELWQTTTYGPVLARLNRDARLEMPPIRFEVTASHAALWREDGQLLLVTALRSSVAMRTGDALGLDVTMGATSA